MEAPRSVGVGHGIDIRLFGPMRLFLDGVETDLQRWKSKKALTLLKMLAARRGARLPKDVLIDALWPEDADFERSSHNLHTVVYYLRRELEPCLKRYERAKVVRQSAGLYWLEESADVRVDVADFRRLLKEAEGVRADDPKRALELYRQALDLYTDDLLPENLYDDWAAGVREELREKYVAGVAAASELTGKLGEDPSWAVQLCRRTLQRDPLREELHRSLIYLLARQGLFGEAAEQYRQCERILYDEFQVPPSPATRIAYEQVMAAAAAAPREPVSGLPSGFPEHSLEAEGEAEGPTMCGPETYLLLHKLELSRQAYTGLPLSLLRIGLGAGRGEAGPDDADRARCVTAVRVVLRAGDVFCWEAPGRLLIQLPATDDEGALSVKAKLEEALERAGLAFFDIRHVVLERDFVSTGAEADSSGTYHSTLPRAAGQGGDS